MFFNRLTQWSPIMLSVLRIMVGLLFLEHGMSKILGFPTSAMMNAPMMSLGWFSGCIELVTGALITIGLLTRPAAFLASGMSAFAYFIGHFHKDFFPMNNGGDAAILFCFVLLYFVFSGPGSLSADAAIGTE